ncbi:BolA family protein [Xinfangfangia sp. CPCC 101601]|uniref:BolA family protein n=1 Tax=Pseudogemmobacter lacusdianii TaxID=3069608 RepID=A0ABU0W106_9RHOB|nr:BolA family protein [Xinfangfangia sp. CPCC 101601]MDQ2067583.1 BolA family protein [Xinfangfangia sp. CPCC 101601]
MNVKTKLEERLTAAFAPHLLEVVNESHLHGGHAGDDGSGESHFQVKIRAQAFAAMGRVERHRAVHKALGELTKTIHALGLDIAA